MLNTLSTRQAIPAINPGVPSPRESAPKLPSQKRAQDLNYKIINKVLPDQLKRKPKYWEIQTMALEILNSKRSKSNENALKTKLRQQNAKSYTTYTTETILAILKPLTKSSLPIAAPIMPSDTKMLDTRITLPTVVPSARAILFLRLYESSAIKPSKSPTPPGTVS